MQHGNSGQPRWVVEPDGTTLQLWRPLPPLSHQRYEMRLCDIGPSYYIDHSNHTSYCEDPRISKAPRRRFEKRRVNNDEYYWIDLLYNKTHWVDPCLSEPSPQSLNMRRTKDGRSFWVNHRTGTTSWSDAGYNAEQSGPLPAGWHWYLDGRAIVGFHNVHSGNFTWEDPRLPRKLGGPVQQPVQAPPRPPPRETLWFHDSFDPRTSIKTSEAKWTHEGDGPYVGAEPMIRAYTRYGS